jgi:hypothetical protein
VIDQATPETFSRPRFAARALRMALEMLVALSLAFLIWLYTRGCDQNTLDHVPIPVQVCLAPEVADQYDLEVTGPSRVQVSFSGPPSRIRELRGKLQRGEVKVALMLSIPPERSGQSRYRDTLRVEPGDVPVPPGVTVFVFEDRNRIPVTVRRLVERLLPVRLDYTDERISQVKLDPATVLVHGPQDILDRTRALSTLPYALPSSQDQSSATSLAKEYIKGTIRLTQELDGRPIRTTPASVAFRLHLRPLQKTYELSAVPIRFLCPTNLAGLPRFANANTGTVCVRVTGPAADGPPQVEAFVDLTRGKYGPGDNEGFLEIQLPRDYQLAEEPSRRVLFRLEPVPVAAQPPRKVRQR